LNGKKFAWQGVALLPFVDETRLFAALEPYYQKLTDAERKFNFSFVLEFKLMTNKLLMALITSVIGDLTVAGD
jgi:5'-3' exonuclease